MLKIISPLKNITFSLNGQSFNLFFALPFQNDVDALDHKASLKERIIGSHSSMSNSSSTCVTVSQSMPISASNSTLSMHYQCIGEEVGFSLSGSATQISRN
jgi:hypothetical protein